MFRRRLPRRHVVWFTAALVFFGLVHWWTSTPSARSGETKSVEVKSVKAYIPAITVPELQKAYERANSLPAQTKDKVYRTKLTPHWFAGNTQFWYRNDNRGGGKEFILVNAEQGTRQPAFDHAKLAEALSKSAGTTYKADRLPFDTIEFQDSGKLLQFSTSNAVWKCELANYNLTKTAKADTKKPDTKKEDAKKKEDTKKKDIESEPTVNDDVTDDELIEIEPDPFDDVPQKKGGKGGFGPQQKSEAKSPDGKWTATIKDFNVFLKGKEGDAEIQLTKDGVEKNAYSNFTWAPDSKTLTALRTETAETLKAAILDSVPKGQLRPKVTEWNYRIPGDKVEVRELWLFDVAEKKAVKVDMERLDFGPPPVLRWKKDGSRFTFVFTHRGHQRERLVEVNARTGKTRDLIDEKTTTRLVRAKNYLNYVEEGKELIWASERDGWNHLYLIDGETGKVKHQITRGPWVVRKVESVDEKARQIWFSASARNLDEDPYLIHYYRVNFDGTDLTPLTEGNGNHTITYSPDKKYLFDSYSRTDLPPVTNLRRVADGALVCNLERADASALLQTGISFAEPFHSLGRDGQTEIWGVVYKPSNYDPNKRYPIVEYIYAGPWTATAPKVFGPNNARQSLAELGFFVVIIDGMGTPNRSKAFHDMSHHNNGDCGLPDRMLWMKALAKKYPCIDLDRVGIYGHSGGGYSSLRALLMYPDFYKVAVSSSGNHDPRTYNLGYTEQWMSFPIGDHYKDQSNVTHAHKLQGKLLLVHGEVDNNVVPSMTTMKVVDALIKAEKDFDLLIMPGKNHGLTGNYFNRRTWDYFVRHLHGIEPPEVNSKRKTSTTP